jgi:hypothetical protein
VIPAINKSQATEICISLHPFPTFRKMSLPDYRVLVEELSELAIESDAKAYKRFQHYVELLLKTNAGSEQTYDHNFRTLRIVGHETGLPFALAIHEYLLSMKETDYEFDLDFDRSIPGHDQFSLIAQLVEQLHDRGREQELLKLLNSNSILVQHLVVLLQNHPLMVEFCSRIIQTEDEILRDLPNSILELVLQHADAKSSDTFFYNAYADDFQDRYLLPTYRDPKSSEAVNRWKEYRVGVIHMVQRNMLTWKYHFPTKCRPLAKDSEYTEDDFVSEAAWAKNLVKYTVVSLDPVLAKKLVQMNLEPTSNELIEYMKLVPTHPSLNPRKKEFLKVLTMGRRGSMLALRRAVRKETENEEEGWAVYAKLLRDLGEEDEAPRRVTSSPRAASPRRVTSSPRAISPPRGGAGASPRARSPRK